MVRLEEECGGLDAAHGLDDLSAPRMGVQVEGEVVDCAREARPTTLQPVMLGEFKCAHQGHLCGAATTERPHESRALGQHQGGVTPRVLLFEGRCGIGATPRVDDVATAVAIISKLVHAAANHHPTIGARAVCLEILQRHYLGGRSWFVGPASPRNGNCAADARSGGPRQGNCAAAVRGSRRRQYIARSGGRPKQERPEELAANSSKLGRQVVLWVLAVEQGRGVLPTNSPFHQRLLRMTGASACKGEDLSMEDAPAIVSGAVGGNLSCCVARWGRRQNWRRNRRRRRRRRNENRREE
mmetsp:Transcript_128159/g.409728  ORF Transcript_128159/g.409728 Transcript_128159/m.409728 type:complete len:298 (-) Transcript_128159:581-1474(-)